MPDCAWQQSNGRLLNIFCKIKMVNNCKLMNLKQFYSKNKADIETDRNIRVITIWVTINRKRLIILDDVLLIVSKHNIVSKHSWLVQRGGTSRTIHQDHIQLSEICWNLKPQHVRFRNTQIRSYAKDHFSNFHQSTLVHFHPGPLPHCQDLSSQLW